MRSEYPGPDGGRTRLLCGMQDSHLAVTLAQQQPDGGHRQPETTTDSDNHTTSLIFRCFDRKEHDVLRVMACRSGLISPGCSEI